MTTQDGTEREGLDTEQPLTFDSVDAAIAYLVDERAEKAALLAALGRAEAERDTLQSEVELLRGEGRTFATGDEAIAWLQDDPEARLAAAEAVVEAAGELEFLDEPCSHLPLEMIDGVMEACDVCALRHALATYRKTTGSQQEAKE